MHAEARSHYYCHPLVRTGFRAGIQWVDLDTMKQQQLTESSVARCCSNRASGRADPFGLLVIVVMVALSITVFVQIQAAAPGGLISLGSETACVGSCTNTATHP